MLQITIPEVVSEKFNDETNEFVYEIVSKAQTLQLEHSLISLSKWESKWCKPFLSSSDKTDEETIDYIRCMTLTSNVKPEVYYNLSAENIAQVDEYINAPMTATTFNNNGQSATNREVITAELVYYWMICNSIPFECQKWHLNRLLALIRVCNIKNTPAKKMSRSEVMTRNASLNAARRAKLKSKG